MISTDPAAGKEAQKGSKVSLTISKGIEQVEIPDIIGNDEETAQKKLTEAGLKPVAGKAKYSDSVDKGKVISATPAAGEKVSKGTEVTYVLSKGANTKEVPWVTGQTQDTAYTNLTNAGFEVNIVEDYDDDVDEGLVIWQDPAGETKQKKGSTITICISLGSQMVDIPDVVGMTVSDARAILENAGFKVSEASSYTGNAIVTNQSSTGQAKEGATINITAKEPSPEPSSSTSAAGDDEDENEDGNA